MQDLPERPDEHVLGDIAVDAFKRLLPPRWIFRSKPPDYGIDGEVELVAENGRLTGRLFYVQSKGTEVESLDKALIVRLKCKTANYYRTLDLPVLIVRYHAPANRVYAKWFDPMGSPSVAGASTVSIKLSIDDEFNETHSANIARELESIRAVKFHRLMPPISVSLSCAGSAVAGFSSTEIISKIKSSPSASLLAFAADGLVDIKIGLETTNIRIASAYNLSLETQLIVGSATLDVIVGNLTLAIGLCLGRLGQSHAAAMLIVMSADRGDLLKVFLWGVEAALYMATDNRPAEALDIARSALESPGALQIAQLMAAVPMLAGSESTQDLHTQLLRRIVIETERQTDNLQRATAHYNLGNHLRAVGLKREALHHYHLAVQADPQYANRSYFWRELGGLLFALQRFHASAKSYERAEQKGDRQCKPLLADAQLWAGLYSQAIRTFDEYLKSVEVPHSEWVLKQMFAKILRDKLGMDAQRRDRALGLKLADPNRDEFSETQFLEALRADGLCGLAWFNMAATEVRTKNYEDASVCFMAAALCQPNDLAAWCSAIGSAINCHDVNLLGHLIAAGYRTSGERFVEALIEYIKNQPTGFPKEQVIKLLGEFLAVIPPVEKQNILRILGGNAGTTT